MPLSSSLNFDIALTSTSRLSSGWAFNELSGISHLSAPQFSSRSIELTDDSQRAQYTIREGSEIGSNYGAMTVFKEEVQIPSHSSQERGVNDELYDQLEQAMDEADSSKLDAFEESIRRRKAEIDAMDARRKNTCNNDKSLSEIQLKHEKEDKLVEVVVKVVHEYRHWIVDYKMVVREIEDGLVEKMEQDIDDEGKEDKEDEDVGEV
ncbi:hypothetical protein Tco_1531072 [Tanacetum coccineum]